MCQQITKAIHNETDHQGPVWGKGDWCVYLLDWSYYENVKRYVERHNVRRGRPATVRVLDGGRRRMTSAALHVVRMCSARL
jgi:hypothetical protein